MPYANGDAGRLARLRGALRVPSQIRLVALPPYSLSRTCTRRAMVAKNEAEARARNAAKPPEVDDVWGMVEFFFEFSDFGLARPRVACAIGDMLSAVRSISLGR